ncbi:MAG: diaminopimelate decarboxylase [Saprospiraceae bacterium]|nr:diaminopimelate decarboxylase [Saprospiraceae bacterium]
MGLIRQHTNLYPPVVRWAKNEKLIDLADTAVIFYDFDILDNRLAYLRSVFPEGTLHAVAIKSNPLKSVLQYIGQQGFGLEAASLEETILANRAGLPADRIVFDSPAKTKAEIAYCATHFNGLHFNANSLEELDRLPTVHHLKVGLRINPLVDPGSPDVYNVSTAISKFGVPIHQWDDIIQALVRYPFIEGLHLHIGSEMSRLDSHAQAVKKVLELAKAVTAKRKANGITQTIDWIDIGGGFPAQYANGPQRDLTDYLHFLQKHNAELFTDYRIITEFGRFVQAHTAWLVSDVEYVLQSGASLPDVPIIHCGADLLLREIYQPKGPVHQIAVLDPLGNLKHEDTWPVHLAGPLCFAGDYLARDIELPRMCPGDQVVVADIGANSFGMWSRHCSRLFPKVIGYSQQRGEIRVIKDRERIEDMLRFWG